MNTLNNNVFDGHGGSSSINQRVLIVSRRLNQFIIYIRLLQLVILLHILLLQQGRTVIEYITAIGRERLTILSYLVWQQIGFI